LTAQDFPARDFYDGKEGERVPPSPAFFKGHFVIKQRYDFITPCPLRGGKLLVLCCAYGRVRVTLPIFYFTGCKVGDTSLPPLARCKSRKYGLYATKVTFNPP